MSFLKFQTLFEKRNCIYIGFVDGGKSKINDEKFPNETYYKDLSKYKLDYLKDTWMNKYKETICKTNNKNALDLGCGLGQDTQWISCYFL